MADRQDIDALLISALYGELTPADEARLQTHLDSHPADRTALADMTLARNAVRESRILTVQLDPPQAVSALLLQEAARRAPKMEKARAEQGGWFQRFARSFMGHPAMAAAAMLVLVVGVAGLIYARRGGDHLAEQHVSTRSDNTPPAATAPAETSDESAALAHRAGSAFEAQLKDDDRDLKKAEGAKADSVADPKGQAGRLEFGADKVKQADPKPQVTSKPRTGDTYITVPRATPQVKELDERPAAKTPGRRDANAVSNVDVDGRVGSVNGAGGAAPRPDPAPATVENRRNAPGLTPAQPPPPPPAATVDRSVTPTAPAGEEARDQKANEDTAWAREIHARVVNAVRANNCREAGQLALSLSNRAPGYYAQNVENDRAVKQCVTYINAEREKEAERVQRARAQRRSTEEAAPKAAKPSSTSK